MKNLEVRVLKEEKVFEVSEKAREAIKEFFEARQELSPIRIVASGGC